MRVDEMKNFLILVVMVIIHRSLADVSGDGVIMPTKCEVCKYLVVELQDRLDETGKSKEVIRTGHGLDPSKKKAIDYRKSDLRLIEALHEPHICKKILQYNLHKEREGSLRFAKGRSQTMDTLHGLVDKGVKVDLGIPYDLWDSTSVEVAQMQRVCDTMVEEWEEDLEDWYYHKQDQNLMKYLCRDRILKYGDKECLKEEFVPKIEGDEEDKDKPEEKKPKKKEKKRSKKNMKGEEGSRDVDDKSRDTPKHKDGDKPGDAPKDEL